jgi:anaphase-promoting complex subunit 7
MKMALQIAPDSLTPLQREAYTLYEAKQFPSCDLVAQMLPSDPIALELRGDCALALQEHRRAISFYRKAASTSKSEASRLVYKEAHSLAQLGCILEACDLLERFSGDKHWSISLLTGHLYILSHRHQDAVRVLTKALTENPYALQAVQWLAILNAERNNVISAVQQGLRSKSSASTASAQELPVVELVTAHFLQHRHQTSLALQAFQELDQMFPSTTCLKLEIASLQVQLGQEEEAKRTFRKIRSMDETCMDKMDEYARLLQDDTSVLNELASQLLELNDSRPEPWIVLALYHASDLDKALAFCDKAISINPQHANAHRVKGTLLLNQHLPDKAAASLFHANEITHDIASYEGLVECYLARQQYKEAICMAREAISLEPRNARAVTLVGLALRQASPQQAQRAFEKALRLDPHAIRPLLALVDLHLSNSNAEECVDLLVKAKENSAGNMDLLETRLGLVYMEMQEFVKAITCFHTALSLNPENHEAQQGMERLEKIMRGEVVEEEGGMNTSY